MHSAEHFRTLVMLNMHLLLVIKLLNHLNRVSSKRVQKLNVKQNITKIDCQTVVIRAYG